MRRPRLMGPKISGRGAGRLLLAVGLVILVALALVPVPDRADLNPRPGTLLDARHERFSPCRRAISDCTRTMITVRHPDGEARYNLADADPASMEVGAPITVWTYPEIRGFSRVRPWHVVQADRVIRDYAPQAADDRRIRLAFLLLCPVLLLGGGWLARKDDERARR